MTKNISKIHQEVLDKKGQELLLQLIPYAADFILGGGTALALQLNHRKSFDFDFFTSSSISKGLFETISKDIKIAKIAIDTINELTFFTKDKIKITFLSYPFGHIFPIEKLDNGLQIFSVKDIAIKKAYTIGRRGEYRDYFDLYTILKGDYINLKDLLVHTKKIYGSVFEEKIFLQQLVYFDDLLNFEITSASSNPIPQPEEVKQFFVELVKIYL